MHPSGASTSQTLHSSAQRPHHTAPRSVQTVSNFGSSACAPSNCNVRWWFDSLVLGLSAHFKSELPSYPCPRPASSIRIILVIIFLLRSCNLVVSVAPQSVSKHPPEGRKKYEQGCMDQVQAIALCPDALAGRVRNSSSSAHQLECGWLSGK